MIEMESNLKLSFKWRSSWHYFCLMLVFPHVFCHLRLE